MNFMPEQFKSMFKDVQERVHETAREKGFWEHPAAEYLSDRGRAAYSPEDHNKSEKLMLIVSELSEAQNAIRESNPPSEKIPGFLEVEEELADAVIRIMDFAEAFDYRLAEAIVAKMAMNKTRPHKHGKEF